MTRDGVVTVVIILVMVILQAIGFLILGDSRPRTRCQEYETRTVFVPVKVGKVTVMTPSQRKRCTCWVENLAEYSDDQPCVERR